MNGARAFTAVHPSCRGAEDYTAYERRTTGQRASMNAQSDMGGVAVDSERGVRYWWVNHKRAASEEL